MNEPRLSPCRTCGKEISTNLAVRASAYRPTMVVGCPHCGEAEPHLTQEDIERIREQEKIDEKNAKKLHEANLYELEKQAKRDKIYNWGCLYPLIGLFIILVICVVSCGILIGTGGC